MRPFNNYKDHKWVSWLKVCKAWINRHKRSASRVTHNTRVINLNNPPALRQPSVRDASAASRNQCRYPINQDFYLQGRAEGSKKEQICIITLVIKSTLSVSKREFTCNRSPLWSCNLPIWASKLNLKKTWSREATVNDKVVLTSPAGPQFRSSRLINTRRISLLASNQTFRAQNRNWGIGCKLLNREALIASLTRKNKLSQALDLQMATSWALQMLSALLARNKSSLILSMLMSSNSTTLIKDLTLPICNLKKHTWSRVWITTWLDIGLMSDWRQARSWRYPSCRVRDALGRPSCTNVYRLNLASRIFLKHKCLKSVKLC